MNELEDYFPKNQLGYVRATAAKYNELFAQGRISESEYNALLESLAHTGKLMKARNEQENKLLLEKAINILKLIPIG
jgi:hypothetical protein